MKKITKILLALFLVVCYVVAQESGEEEEESDEFEEDREVSFEQTEDSVKMTSTSETRAEELIFEVNGENDGMEIAFEYKNAPDGVTGVAYTVYITSLVEYTDTNGDNQLGAEDIDSIIERELPGDGIDWEVSGVMTDTEKFQFTMGTTDNVFSVDFILPKKLLDIGPDIEGNQRPRVSPGLLKFTINVMYTPQVSNNKVALRVLVITRQEDATPEDEEEGADREGEESVRVASPVGNVFLSWEKFVTEGTGTLDIVSSKVLEDDPDEKADKYDPPEEEDEETRFLYFTIDKILTQNELLNVSWDPALGIRGDIPDSAGKLAASFALIVMALLL